MRRSIAALFCFFLALVSQSAGATNYHVYRKFEPVCHDNELKRCNHHRCTSAHMDLTQDISPDCQRSLESRISAAIAVAGGIDTGSGPHRQSDPSKVWRVAQADTAKPNVPEIPSTKKSATAPGSAAIAKWHKALLARLARYYPAQANSAEGVVSLAFTIDRKGNVVSSRIEKTSGSTVLDAEALALLARAAPLPAPPPEVADPDLTFVLPIRFAAGKKH